MQQMVLFSQRTVQLPSIVLSQTQAELTWTIQSLELESEQYKLTTRPAPFFSRMTQVTEEWYVIF